jgi:hypothetical protein
MTVIGNTRATLKALQKLRNELNIDFSSGRGDISSPEEDPIHMTALTENKRASMTEVQSGIEFVGAQAGADDSTVLWVHQVGKQVVRKVPDTALLGVLVIIAAELLRRGVNANRDTLPPLLRDFAETTITELDLKLETLSSLDWKVDPFFQGELENLQTQPLEVIDKFIVAQILPSVDKDFAPFLLKYMTGDTERVKTVTRNVKDLIELAVEILKIERVASLQLTKSSIIEQVDIVGNNIEEVINDWNSKITGFTGRISGYLNTGSVKSLLVEAFLLPLKSNAGSLPSSSSSSNSSLRIGNKPKTLMWRKNEPWKIYTVESDADDGSDTNPHSTSAPSTSSAPSAGTRKGADNAPSIANANDPNWVRLKPGNR